LIIYNNETLENLKHSKTTTKRLHVIVSSSKVNKTSGAIYPGVPTAVFNRIPAIKMKGWYLKNWGNKIILILKITIH
jgi:hypothetical protein